METKDLNSTANGAAKKNDDNKTGKARKVAGMAGGMAAAAAAGVAGTMFLGKAGGICDPAAAIIVSIFIIAVSVKMAVPALHELLEISLPEHELRSISEAIASTSGVKAFHHLRTRRSGADVIVDMHIKVDPGITVEEAHNIATEVEDKVRDLYIKGTPIVTVHVEPYRGESVRSDGSC